MTFAELSKIEWLEQYDRLVTKVPSSHQEGYNAKKNIEFNCVIV